MTHFFQNFEFRVKVSLSSYKRQYFINRDVSTISLAACEANKEEITKAPH